MLKALLAAFSIFTFTIFGASAPVADTSLFNDEDIFDAESDFGLPDEHGKGVFVTDGQLGSVSDRNATLPDA